jgi:hypothetical protein
MTKEYIQDDGQLRVFIVPVDILDVPDLSSSEKLVYIVLRSYVNPTDPTAFPAYETIAKKASLSRRRVIDIVKSLTEKGLIVKKHEFTVTNQRKIRNTSNRYTLITPKRAIPSEIISPPPVKPFHPPSETISPYHNHLTESFRNMIDCMGAEAEIATAAEPDPIYEALNKFVPSNCYVDNMPLSEGYINDIYLMLANQFMNRLDPEVVKIACELYFDRACEINVPHGVVMKLNIENPVGFYRRCYEDAIKQYKVTRNRNR